MRAKTKRALRRRKRQRHQERLVSRSITLEVSSLEVAAGFDGLFRGDPEPVLVCGIFGMADNKAVLIARGVGRFARPIRYPAVVKMADSQLADGRLSTTSEPLVAVVVMALEEDGGRDIRRAYGILQSHGELHLIESCDQPNASDIGELLLRPAEWKQPKKVTLAVDGQSFDAECRSDKWIAASAFSAPLRTTHRVHLVSDDKTNDWTAVLTLRRR
jgi:hypothetical protein